MKFYLRPMEPGDVPRVAAIDRVSFPTPWSPSAFKSELKRASATYLVLLRDDQDEATSDERPSSPWFRRFFGLSGESGIVGYVGFRVQSGQGHITTIALDPDWRGHGLGTYLLLVALSRMASSGVQRVTLEMRPSNDVAYQLYRKHGFEVVEYRRGYYRDGEDAWVMAVDMGETAYQRQLDAWREETRRGLDEHDVGAPSVA